MLVLACAGLALLAVPLTGGRLSRLADVRWRHPWLLLVTFAVQFAALQLPGVPHAVSAAVHAATYALAGAFVAVNRRVAGLWLLALGAASNGVVIALNGGTLPSSAAARAAAGIEDEEGFANSGPVADPVLAPLGDVFAVPEPFPLANVFSVGDVLVVAGTAWVVLAACHRRGARVAGRAARTARAAPGAAPGAPPREGVPTPG